MNSILSPTHPIYLPLVLFLAIYLWNEPTDASTGVARTTSGESFTGEIRTTAAGASVQPKTGSEHAIPLAELQMLRFQSVESPQVTPTGEEKSHLRIFTFPLRHFEGSPTTRLSSLSEWEGKPTKLSATEGSIAFDGILVPWASGKYQFFLQSQGLARAWVQGQLVGSILATNELRESSTEIFLKSEQRYSFLVEFDPAADTSSLKLEWSGPGIPRGPIPEGRLLHNPKTSTRTELAKGLLATYYGNPDQSNPRLIRIDRSVDFNWRTNAPYPDAGVFSKFSATWSGEFEVPETASYRFGIEMEGGVKLYAAGERIYERFEDMEMSPFGIGAFPITIEAGKRHKIRVEFFNSVARASLKVGFWSQENSKAPVLADRLYPDSPPDLSIPVGTNAMSASQVTPPGVLLTDGTFIASQPESISATTLTFGKNSPLSSISMEAVSRIQFASAPRTTVERLENERNGLLLHAGDFLEGDLMGLDAREVKLGSILFGNRGVERDRVLAALIRPSSSAAPKWSITTSEGSIFQLQELSLTPEAVVGNGTSVGRLRLPISSVSELRRNAP